MSQKYRVKSLAVSGRNNKIYRVGDIVSAGKFPEGRAESLVKEGHLEYVVEEPAKVETPPKVDPPTPPVEGNEGTEGNGTDAPPAEESEAESASDLDEGQPVVTDNNDKVNVVEEPAKVDESVSRETPAPSIDEINTKDLKKNLKDLGVEFEKDATKEELWQLWLLNRK